MPPPGWTGQPLERPAVWLDPAKQSLKDRTKYGDTQQNLLLKEIKEMFVLSDVHILWISAGLWLQVGSPNRLSEGLLFLHGLESNPGSSLQTEEEAGLP